MAANLTANVRCGQRISQICGVVLSINKRWSARGQAIFQLRVEITGLSRVVLGGRRLVLRAPEQLIGTLALLGCCPI